MPRCLADLDKSVLLVVDVQPKFMKGMFEADRVLRRTLFICECASILGCPIIATEQYPERMGATEPAIGALLSVPASSKMQFSSTGCSAVQGALSKERKTVVLVGIETHICVYQTAHDLLEAGHEVIVGIDAVSARTKDRHEIGLGRLSQAGAVIAHTEAIVYEWMRSADHPQFREILKLVKDEQPVS